MVNLFSLSKPEFIQESENEFVEALLEVTPDFDLENLYYESEEATYSYNLNPWEMPDEEYFLDQFISLIPFGSSLK